MANISNAHQVFGGEFALTLANVALGGIATPATVWDTGGDPPPRSKPRIDPTAGGGAVVHGM